ncbi:Uncharacterized protein TCM_034873 [Theobroma cacao]|uniref:Secreted protein n=1 Tax=Theobroma cacao TaxID=3641 RepID=A0A061FGC2_THECC|nr:Uncharacterized protein TCM_034873 [Theobroma cacao]
MCGTCILAGIQVAGCFKLLLVGDLCATHFRLIQWPSPPDLNVSTQIFQIDASQSVSFLDETKFCMCKLLGCGLIRLNVL